MPDINLPVNRTGRLPKILIAYTNTGGGHLSAARALQAAIQQRYPHQYDVVIFNVSAASGSRSINLLYESYNLMLKADPRYAKHGLRLLNVLDAERVVIPMVPRAYRNVRHQLLREAPDIIVSVHAIVNHSLLRMMKDLHWYGRIPYVILCTDLTNNFLKGWANSDADRLIVFSEMAKRQMVDFGVPAKKVLLHHGFAVNPSFFQSPLSREESRSQLGIEPDARVVLISLGGMAIPRKTKEIVKALIASKLPVHLLVVCGMNRTLKRQMHYLARSTTMKVHVFGFTQRLPIMMGAADVMIGKPGPGTLMEAVVKELPLLLDDVSEPMPQEKGNLKLALQQGIAHSFTTYRQVPRLVEWLLTDTEAYQQMQENMRRIRNEQAIFEVAETVLSLLPARAAAG